MWYADEHCTLVILGYVVLLYIFITFFCFTGFAVFLGFFLASIMEHEAHITYTVIGTMLALFLTSGMCWPLEGMMPPLHDIVLFSPWAKAVEGYRSVSVRGWGLQNPYVFSAFNYNVATVFILTVANVISAKRNKTC